MHIFHYILNHSLILLLHILDLSYNLHMDILFLHKINNEMYLLNHIMILGFDLFSFLYSFKFEKYGESIFFLGEFKFKDN